MLFPVMRGAASMCNRETAAWTFMVGAVPGKGELALQESASTWSKLGQSGPLSALCRMLWVLAAPGPA